MRTRIALLALLAACAAAPATAQVQGSYRLVSINGQPLPAPSPDEDGVTVYSASFDLGGDGRFALSMSPSADGAGTQQLAGTYQVAGDSLVLTPVPEDEPFSLGWTLQGDTLGILNDDRDVYRFVRQAQAAAAGGPSPGLWQLTHINGLPVPVPWPDNEMLIVDEMSLEITAGGQVTLRARGTLQGEAIQDEDTSPYRITGDRFALLGDDGSVNDEFTWSVTDGRLQLVDEDGAVFTFTPADGPARP